MGYKELFLILVPESTWRNEEENRDILNEASFGGLEQTEQKNLFVVWIPGSSKASGSQGDQKIGKKVPKIWKSSPNSCQTKYAKSSSSKPYLKVQNIYTKPLLKS